MQTMNQALFTAYANMQITLNEALGRSTDHQELQAMITKSGLKAA
jgi:Tfp pilus assembly ATPase PilU